MKQNKFLQNLYLKSPGFLKSIIATAYSFLISKRKYSSYFKKWEEIILNSQYYDKKELESHLIEILKIFLLSANENSSYYREIISKNSIDIHNIESLDILKKFPIINKKIVRENYNKIINKSIPSYKFVSSGTTGASLAVHLSQEAYQREYAFRWNYLKTAGASRKDKFVYFLGNKLFNIEKENPPFHIKDFYEKGLYFSIFHMNDKNLFFFVQAFNKYKPNFVKGYPSGLYVYADFVLRNNLKLHQVKAVFSASETLHDYQKTTIKRAFGCEVYEWYGQVETTINIQQCDYHKFHVMENYGYLELLNDKEENAKPGEIANVIGTSWGNNAFPLIRYDTGDNMILSADQNCQCGRTGRIIERIIGRDEDIIITPDGRKIGRLDFVFKPIDSVLESQIIQENINEIKIKIVILPNYEEEDAEKIKHKLQDYIGSDVKIIIEKVNRIERTNNGKIRYVISSINQRSR